MARTATSATAEPARRDARRRRNGFTLIELLVVMVILALGAGIAMAMIGRNVATVSARGVASDIAAALRATRAQAIRSGDDAVFVLDVTKHRLRAPDTDRALPDTVTLTVVTAATERIDRDSGRIRFYADGSSTGGRITVQSGSRLFHVGVDWLTGRVTFTE